ncbi:sugar kinase [Tropicimonas sp. IMCC34043]|uniref:sugar kinase n=1 Tax=Tropicimonas sp. IMCC34043 TaxID=2248760 RepID=UPI0018E5A4C5|nr:sugar kinase [Tropicimonas sp. IMCC34043]
MLRKIACVGEAMVELRLDAGGQSAQIGFAGDTLNTAIYLRRGLPEGFDVQFVSAVGLDAFSERMLAAVAAEGVGTEHIAQHPSRTVGLYAISTDAAGERSFAYWRDNSAARTLFSDPEGPEFAALAGHDLVYYSAITLAILAPEARSRFMDWIAGFRAAGGQVAFDSNYRPRLWPDRATAQTAVAAAWRACDVAFPSVDDEIALFGDQSAEDVLARIEGYGPTCGALKRGGEGPLPIGSRLDALPDFPRVERVIDTTAAGDSFVAGFLSVHARGGSLADALRAGHDYAACVITHPGAIVPKDIWGDGPA